MSQTLRLAVSQSHTLSTTSATLSALERTCAHAATQSIDLILFPEAYLGGYPRTATFGAAVGARTNEGREQFLHYFKDAVDLGDTPEGAGRRWVERTLEGEDGKVGGRRGDGTREELERITRETGLFVVTGVVERCAGTLYCAVLYICPRKGVLGKRRKVMPTGSERLIWGQGQPSSLRAITTTIRGVKLTLAAAICWENYMPLLRHSLYSQNVNLYLAPTADAKDTWVPLMRTVASEGRCVVLSANQCVKRSNLPAWITGGKKDDGAQGDQANKVNGNSQRPRLRRDSTVTEDGHEIALPQRVEQNGGPHTPTKLRRKSTVTEDGNEVALPVLMDLPLLDPLEQVGDSSTPTTSRRKLSDVDESEAGTSSVPRNPRKSCMTEEGHEIALPEGRDPAKTEGTTKSPHNTSDFVSRGGSCIISPMGDVLGGPLWDEVDGLLTVDVDFDDCLRGRLDLDVGGSYSRNDAFKLTVDGLDLSPPP